MDFLSLLKNRDMQTNALIIFIAISCLQFFDAKILMSITALILIAVNYPALMELSSDKPQVKKEIKKHEISNDMYYNRNIHSLLLELKKFKKYNKVTYKDGVEYMRKFFKTVHILEYDNLMNRNQYYELANDYLKQSINHFQSISVSMPERHLINGIKRGDFTATKKTEELSKILKELYNECYYILLNIGTTFNEEWSKEPNIYTKEIDLNTDRVESYNENDEVNWALY